MGFTTPRTWLPDEDVTPDLMNVHIRDQFAALSTWLTWEPAWTATGGTPSIGNGSMFGQYRRFGDVCQVRFLLTFGSTTSVGSTSMWRFSLPVATSGSSFPLTAAVVDISAGVYPGCTWLGSASTFGVWTSTSAPVSVGAGTPFVWAVNDLIAVNGTYRV